MAAPQPSRPYDSLYDATYKVASARDHYRQQGQAGGFLVERMPAYGNLFSELPHHPSKTFRVRNNEKLPGFLDRAYHPEGRNAAMLAWKSSPQQVQGANSHLYFKRPLLSVDDMGPPVQYATAASGNTGSTLSTNQQYMQYEADQPATKTIGTQSDYRESEAQTLPWSPDWVLPADGPRAEKQARMDAQAGRDGPELLQLADLKFGDGLPGGLQEVRRLEKLREKAAFESSLPPIDDVARLPLRQRMIEAWEAKEWAERGVEIKGVQDERLALLEQALQVREGEIEEQHRQQLSQRAATLLATKAPKFASLQVARVKAIRHLAQARRQIESLGRPAKQHPIVEQYANYGSPVYAPLQREGRFPETRPAGQTIDTDSFAPASLTAVADLEASLNPRMLHSRIQAPKPPAKPSYKQRREAAMQADVETIGVLLETAKETTGRGVGDCWPCPLQDTAVRGVTAGKGTLASIKSAGKASGRLLGERPSTPEAPPLPEGQEAEEALVLLQRLLRGRAGQNEMYCGKSASLELVRELRLAAEGAGTGPRPEYRDAATQELDSVIGEAVCELCCLLAGDDAEGLGQLLEQLAQHRRDKEAAAAAVEAAGAEAAEAGAAEAEAAGAATAVAASGTVTAAAAADATDQGAAAAVLLAAQAEQQQEAAAGPAERASAAAGTQELAVADAASPVAAAAAVALPDMASLAELASENDVSADATAESGAATAPATEAEKLPEAAVESTSVDTAAASSEAAQAQQQDGEQQQEQQQPAQASASEQPHGGPACLSSSTDASTGQSTGTDTAGMELPAAAKEAAADTTTTAPSISTPPADVQELDTAVPIAAEPSTNAEETSTTAPVASNEGAAASSPAAGSSVDTSSDTAADGDSGSSGMDEPAAASANSSANQAAGDSTDEAVPVDDAGVPKGMTGDVASASSADADSSAGFVASGAAPPKGGAHTPEEANV